MLLDPPRNDVDNQRNATVSNGSSLPAEAPHHLLPRENQRGTGLTTRPVPSGHHSAHKAPRDIYSLGPRSFPYRIRTVEPDRINPGETYVSVACAFPSRSPYHLSATQHCLVPLLEYPAASLHLLRHLTADKPQMPGLECDARHVLMTLGISNDKAEVPAVSCYPITVGRICLRQKGTTPGPDTHSETGLVLTLSGSRRQTAHGITLEQKYLTLGIPIAATDLEVDKTDRLGGRKTSRSPPRRQIGPATLTSRATGNGEAVASTGPRGLPARSRAAMNALCSRVSSDQAWKLPYDGGSCRLATANRALRSYSPSVIAQVAQVRIWLSVSGTTSVCNQF